MSANSGTTARDFVTLALKEAGIIGIGQTPNAEDINDCFTLLNRMFGQWQKKRWIVPNLYDIPALGNNQKSNLIGPGQYYNAARPDKIQAAYFKQLTGSDPTEIVSFPLIPIWSYEDYANIALKDLNSWPQFFFYDAKFPYGNVFIWPVPSSQYEIHLICKGPIGFTVELSGGEITSGGINYTDGVYTQVPLVNLTSFGSGATADITVAGGIVTNVSLNSDDNPGDGYEIGDELTATTIGAGTGFIYTVTDVNDDLNAIFNMPPEYEEAIHYNLTKRIRMHYQYNVTDDLRQMAKTTLNTIKIANAQIPSLQMPPELRNVRSNNFWIFNADVR